MDSMRSLNRSLPKARPPKPSPESLQAFKDAAMSVTSLYRCAIADAERSRSEGYQEALEDLLNFLDQRHLGESTGEGLLVRQWALDRFDSPGNQTASESDEDTDDARGRSSSPPPEPNATSDHAEPSDNHTIDQNTTTPVEEKADTNFQPPQSMFQFSSPHPYPSSNAANPGSDPVARRSGTPRRSTAWRQAGQNLNLFSIGAGAGQKRKIMQEFFDVSGYGGDRRDANGGGKRSRI
ncbi:uncharacterized protein EI97DRAFT_420994 [Westerdykella ornata]|uniref:Uncharacterized protein n=1 Tax=Westerdykella ornata TaxID=318751 RepID=A0A6A6JH46_WESOR|nr:uncharacterized protein EI97DRAFT_420994 [Westerdykella ornata]KAF2274956.1 hypothetical protein EI97DRAFT_420994 [Westerdykella ornata]